MKTVIGIRCASIGDAEQRLYGLLLAHFPQEDIYFIADHRTYQHDPDNPYQAITIDPAALGISVENDWGWRCGDMCYYAFAERVGSDFYILIESDVWMTHNTALTLFDALAGSTADFIAHNIQAAPPDWLWHATIKPFVPTVYSCAFPLTRLSRRALDFLRPQRAVLNHICKANDAAVPNDESFVASAIHTQQAFQAASLLSLVTLDVSRFSPVYQIPLEFCTEDGFLYHSALSLDDFYQKFFNRLLHDNDPDSVHARYEYAFGRNMKNHSYFEVLRQILPQPAREQFTLWYDSKVLPA